VLVSSYLIWELGTGALVLDRIHKIAYATLSQRLSNLSTCSITLNRCNKQAAQEFADKLGYSLLSFHSICDGAAVYHTNVIMSIGTTVSVICTDVWWSFFAM